MGRWSARRRTLPTGGSDGRRRRSGRPNGRNRAEPLFHQGIKRPPRTRWRRVRQVGVIPVVERAGRFRATASRETISSGDGASVAAGQARSSGFRVATRDRTPLYGDRAVAIVVGPIEPPPLETIRERLGRVSAEPGLERFASRIDAERGRWLPIPAHERQDYLTRAVVELGPEEEADLAAWSSTALAESAIDTALRIFVGVDYAVIALSHAMGDALSVHQVLPALYRTASGDLPETVVGRPPRALLARALAHHYGRNPGRAAQLVRAARRPQPPEENVPPLAGDGWGFVAARSAPGYPRELRRRQGADDGASSTSQLFAAARRLLFEQSGWPLDSSMVVPCDVRRYLPRRVSGYLGNFAAGVTLRVPDAGDAVALDRELRLALACGRPLAAMVLAHGAGLPGRRSRPSDHAHAVPSICLTHHGKLRSYEKLEWRGGPAERWYMQIARPPEGTALTLSFAELSSVLHVGASFDRRYFTSSAMEQVVEQLCGDIDGVARCTS